MPADLRVNQGDIRDELSGQVFMIAVEPSGDGRRHQPSATVNGGGAAAGGTFKPLSDNYADAERLGLPVGTAHLATSPAAVTAEVEVGGRRIPVTST